MSLNGKQLSALHKKAELVWEKLKRPQTEASRKALEQRFKELREEIGKAEE